VTDEQRLFIGGSWVVPDDGFYEVIDPATEGVVGLAPEASRDQVYAAAAAAREAFGPLPSASAWGQCSAPLRPVLLKPCHRLVLDHSGDGFLVEAHAVDEQIHQVGGECFAWRRGGSPVR